jgi:hypothetical protein
VQYPLVACIGVVEVCSVRRQALQRESRNKVIIGRYVDDGLDNICSRSLTFWLDLKFNRGNIRSPDDDTCRFGIHIADSGEAQVGTGVEEVRSVHKVYRGDQVHDIQSKRKCRKDGTYQVNPPQQCYHQGVALAILALASGQVPLRRCKQDISCRIGVDPMQIFGPNRILPCVSAKTFERRLSVQEKKTYMPDEEICCEPEVDFEDCHDGVNKCGGDHGFSTGE